MRSAPHHNPWVHRAVAAATGAALFLVLATLPACEKPLFSPEEERSQYDRYDAIRAQHSASYLEDEFGRRHPNLRGRLVTKQ